MNLSITYRIMLLALLPGIALLLYFKGQQYDPALITFESLDTEIEKANVSLPNDFKGFSRTGQVRFYTKDNLYEYVDGHAEYFLSAGFKSLVVSEYSSRDAVDGKSEIVIDIYDMGKSIQAFGILSDESGGNLYEISPGLTGFKTPLGLSFAKGQYYIKISFFREDIPLGVITERVNSAISSQADPFPEFSLLPDIGSVLSTRFIKEAYRGLDFVNNVIEREYDVNGETMQVFVITGKKQEIEKLVDSFLSYFDRSDIEYNEIEKKGRTFYTIKDPYEGDWVLIPYTDLLFGVYGAFNESIVNSLASNQSKDNVIKTQ